VSLITAPNPRYNQFPLAKNDWETINPAPDMTPSLHTEEEGGDLHGCMNHVGFRWKNLFSHFTCAVRFAFVVVLDLVLVLGL
jgi:hypothetical protein